MSTADPVVIEDFDIGSAQPTLADASTSDFQPDELISFTDQDDTADQTQADADMYASSSQEQDFDQSLGLG